MDNNPNSPQTPGTNQPADEVQTTLSPGRNHASGSAMLDAEIALSNQTQTEPDIDYPVATNLTGNSDTDDPTDAQAVSTTAAYPADAKRLEKDYDTPEVSSNQTGETNVSFE